jgi:hypothetical protein
MGNPISNGMSDPALLVTEARLGQTLTPAPATLEEQAQALFLSYLPPLLYLQEQFQSMIAQRDNALERSPDAVGETYHMLNNVLANLQSRHAVKYPGVVLKTLQNYQARLEPLTAALRALPAEQNPQPVLDRLCDDLQKLQAKEKAATPVLP